MQTVWKWHFFVIWFRADDGICMVFVQRHLFSFSIPALSKCNWNLPCRTPRAFILFSRVLILLPLYPSTFSPVFLCSSRWASSAMSENNKCQQAFYHPCLTMKQTKYGMCKRNRWQKGTWMISVYGHFQVSSQSIGRYFLFLSSGCLFIIYSSQY